MSRYTDAPLRPERFPGVNLDPFEQEGDAVHFCGTCAFSSVCVSNGLDKTQLNELHVLIEHTDLYHAGDHIFRDGDKFHAIAAVRTGTVKTYVIDREGNEHVLGFHLPGELIGLNAIDGEKYPCNAVALDDVSLCRFSFPKISVLASKLPNLQRQLFRLVSRDIGKAALMSGDWTADQRIAAFLVDMSRRLFTSANAPSRFQLSMARTDIARYLRLAPETVSRVLRRYQEEGLIHVERRDLEILALAKLEAIANPILRA